MNFDEFGGISKSLFTVAAIIPRAKNNRAGFVRLSMSNCVFNVFYKLDGMNDLWITNVAIRWFFNFFVFREIVLAGVPTLFTFTNGVVSRLSWKFALCAGQSLYCINHFESRKSTLWTNSVDFFDKKFCCFLNNFHA